MKLLTTILITFAAAAAFGQPPCVVKYADAAELAALNRAIAASDVPKTDEVYTVPVVVHIIHVGEEYGTGTNITDEQVHSAISALNEDFRKMPGTNGDGAGVDVGIEFCLAERDPDGNPTTGINRVNGCSVPKYCNNGITAAGVVGADELEVKNLSRWPNQSYYNIWVVSEIENNNGASGIQGYAYFPTTSVRDGIVILYNAFGTTGTLKSYTNLNRTLTHEMGHAFSLYHTFQGGSCNTEEDCTLQGDRVCDTPPTTANSNCYMPKCNGTQQVENYMDYTHEVCRNMFTAGQRDRMRAAAVYSRSALLSAHATSCAPTPLPVTWLQFGGTATRQGAKLEWATASEHNTDCYDVEVLFNDDWLVVGTVPAAGFSSQRLDYEFTHLGGGGYYRIAQVDRDGAVDHSEVIHVDGPITELRVIRGKIVAGNGTEVRITDIVGREVVNRDLVPGLYIARNGGKFQKIIVHGDGR